ncbi:MAG: flagellar motor switch protein FliG [Planctomycetia bacterium]|jgi:flagellar motor switch protein FliG|nr:flagellar motor switch protein FliG [Planctomycetia bacterium]MCC7314908.1 flagellar motor switch protein FliG [Planctomycetota bacterium]OQZ06986.1 MAG: flagellar motor switch protein FliG [Planctomycetes bacterium UTPLA1]
MAAATKSAGKSDEILTGLRKVAILIVTLEKESSSAILRQLDSDSIEAITREVASLRGVEERVRQEVIKEFHNLALARSYTEAGGLNYAKMLLTQSLSKDEAERIMRQIEHQFYSKPFTFLHKAETENLLTFIQDEHPQTIALILAHLTASKASEILGGLPPEKQIEVVSRISRMEQTSPEVIKEVERGLEHRLSGLMTDRLQRVGGVNSVAEILNLTDRSTEKGILEALGEDDPDLVAQIRRLMFVFEDVLLVNDKGIQSVLKEIETSDLVLALRTATDELKQKIFSNMSDRAAQMIREEMEYMGPVRLSDVEMAQQRIVDVVRRLEDSGEIIISGRGGEKELIV